MYARLRRSRNVAVWRVRSTAINLFRQDLLRMGFIEIPAPTISTCTDMGRPFRISYYGIAAKLNTSFQLYKQLAMHISPYVYILQPAFRRERLDCRKSTHLSEYWQLDVECRCDLSSVMSLAEHLIAAVTEQLRKQCSSQFDVLGVLPPIPEPPFKRLRFESMNIDDSDSEAISKWLLRKYKSEFVWITDFPRTEHPEWYYAENPDDAKTTATADLYYPYGFGEALSAGQRELSVERIAKRLRWYGRSPKAYSWYLDGLEGLASHAGFGLGLERYVRWACGEKMLQLTVPFPRIPGVLGI